MDSLIRKAGGKIIQFQHYFMHDFFYFLDFELQVTTLECLFRLTTVIEREYLSKQWFGDTVSESFGGIRESFFEVVCKIITVVMCVFFYDIVIFSRTVGSFSIFSTKAVALVGLCIAFLAKELFLGLLR